MKFRKLHNTLCAESSELSVPRPIFDVHWKLYHGIAENNAEQVIMDSILPRILVVGNSTYRPGSIYADYSATIAHNRHLVDMFDLRTFFYFWSNGEELYRRDDNGYFGLEDVLRKDVDANAEILGFTRFISRDGVNGKCRVGADYRLCTDEEICAYFTLLWLGKDLKRQNINIVLPSLTDALRVDKLDMLLGVVDGVPSEIV
jgi:hypothetical protein